MRKIKMSKLIVQPLLVVAMLMLSGCGAYMVSGGESSNHSYQSDRRIKSDVLRRLIDDPKITAKGIHVDVYRGLVTLTGTVRKRWMKRHVTLIVRDVKGVRDVDNQLKFRF